MSLRDDLIANGGMQVGIPTENSSLTDNESKDVVTQPDVTESVSEASDITTTNEKTESVNSNDNVGDIGSVSDIDKPVEIDFSKINESLGREFKSIDELKESLSYKDKVLEFESKLEEYKPFKEKYEGLKDKVGKTKSIFANESIRKLNEIVNQFPDKDPMLVSAISETEFSINTVDGQLKALIANEKLNNRYAQSIDDATILKSILKRNGVDDDLINEPNEWSETAKYEIATSATRAMDELSKYKNIEVPDIIDFDGMEKQALEARGEIEKAWVSKNSDVINSFSDVSVDLGDGEVLKFEVDQAFKQAVGESLLNVSMSYGDTPNESNIQKTEQWLRDHYIALNYEKIVKAAVNKALTKEREKNIKENNNEGVQNTKEAPITQEVVDQFANRFKQGVMGTNSGSWRSGIR